MKILFRALLDLSIDSSFHKILKNTRFNNKWLKCWILNLKKAALIAIMIDNICNGSDRRVSDHARER